MRYNLTKQEKDYFCVPACLQAVLGKYDLNFSQEGIATKINCNENGATPEDTEKFLTSINFNFLFYKYNEIPFKEPEYFIKENLGLSHILVALPLNSETTPKHHSTLLEEFNNPILVLLDPKDTERHFYNLDFLYSQMFEKKSGGFSLIRKL